MCVYIYTSLFCSYNMSQLTWLLYINIWSTIFISCENYFCVFVNISYGMLFLQIICFHWFFLFKLMMMSKFHIPRYMPACKKKHISLKNPAFHIHNQVVFSPSWARQLAIPPYHHRWLPTPLGFSVHDGSWGGSPSSKMETHTTSKVGRAWWGKGTHKVTR